MDILKLSLSADVKRSEVGCLKQKSVADTFQIHTHDFFEFFYIINGKAIHNINGENQLISRGSFVFIRPQDVHKYSFFDHFDMELISCGVESWLIEDACNFLKIDINHFLKPELPPQLILEGSRFFDMEKKLNKIDQITPGMERKQYFLSILPQLLYLIYKWENQNKEVLPVWLSKLIEKMNEPENYIAGLEKLLSLANISQEHLTREFRKHLGITPTEFINTKRINHAADILLKREYEIMDACFMSGFNNLTYFYEIFKKQYNCTPKQFIKNNS